MSLSNRFPKLQEIAPVYAVGVVILYTWSLIATIHDFSRNWIFYLNIADVLSLFTYVLAGAFFESLLLISALLFIYFLFPPKVLGGKFVLYGAILTTAVLGWLMLRDDLFIGLGGLLANPAGWRVFFLVCMAALAVSGSFFNSFRNKIEIVADRCVIFLFVYLPLSVISLMVIVIRNMG